MQWHRLIRSINASIVKYSCFFSIFGPKTRPVFVNFYIFPEPHISDFLAVRASIYKNCIQRENQFDTLSELVEFYHN